MHVVFVLFFFSFFFGGGGVGGTGLGVFSDLSVVIDFSLEGYKFITIRHYYVLPSLNKDSATTTTAAAGVAAGATTPTTT